MKITMTYLLTPAEFYVPEAEQFLEVAV